MVAVIASPHAVLLIYVFLKIDVALGKVIPHGEKDKGADSY